MKKLNSAMTTALRADRRRDRGFTLMDVLITVAIVGILAAIAIPSYTSSVVKTKRRAAQVCLSSFATHMERYYTTNLRYNVAPTTPDPDCAAGTVPTLPSLSCASAQNTGRDYSYSLASTCSTFTLTATPLSTSTSRQATRDAQCGALSLNQTGTRAVTGQGGVSKCW